MRRLAFMIFLAVALLCGHALAAQDQAKAKLEERIQRALKAEESGKPVPHVTPTELVREYGANEVAADAKYKGKWVEIRGRVANVAKDIAGQPYLSLAADSYGMATVQAVLYDAQIKNMAGKDYTACGAMEKAAGIKAGQKVLLHCLGGGSVIGTPRLGQCLVLPDNGR